MRKSGIFVFMDNEEREREMAVVNIHRLKIFKLLVD